jgi:surface protein
MSVIGGQNPIVQDGLVYILDFGNQRSYISGSNTAQSLVYSPVNASFTTPLPGTYSGLAAAYSVRRVVPSYNGPVMEIQSGSVSQSIGFDSNGNLNTASIAAFAGSGDAFVKTWYDQSGNNRHARQTITANQPKIYSGSQGSVVLENGKPAINFDGTNSILFTSTFSTIAQPFSVFHLRKYNTSASTQVSLTLGGSTPYTDVLFTGGKFSMFYGSFLNSTVDSNTNQGIAFSLGNSTNSAISINNETLVTGDAGTQGMQAVYIAGRSDGSFRANFRSQEIIIYQGNKSSDQTYIKNNINSYYNVYTGSDSGPTPNFSLNQTQFNNLNALSLKQSFPGFSYNQGNLTLIFTGETKAASTLFTQNDQISVIGTTSSIGYGSPTNNLGRTFPASGFDHISLRFTTGSVDCFINGIPTAPNSIFPTGSFGTGDFSVPNYSGSLGNLMVYNRPLTDNEIYSIYLQQARRYSLPETPKPYTVDSSVYVYSQAAGITDTVTLNALNTFVQGLKSASLWDKMVAIYPFIGTNPSASRLNLKDVSLNTTQVNYSGSWSTSLSGSRNNNTASYGILSNVRGTYVHPLINSQSIHLSYLSYDTPASGGYLMGVEQIPGLPGDIAQPAAAYSVRKVRTAYSGFCMDVRRDLDDTTGSIGFDVNGNLDTGSLLGFVTGSAGTGSGFVARWYDQSGNNNHATQSVISRQPQIISSGSILTQNSKPTIKHIGTTDLKLATVLNLGTTHTMVGVIKFDSYNKEFIGALTDRWSYAMYNLSGQVDTEARQAVGRTTETFGLNFGLVQYHRNGTTTVSMYKNNSLLGGNSFTLTSNNNFEFRSLSGEEFDGYNFVGNMSEVIIYTSSQANNRQPIDQNINSYFNIYTPLAYNLNTNSLSLFSSPTTVVGAANNVASASFTTGGPIGLITVSRTGSSNYTLWKNKVPNKVTLSPSTASSFEIYLNAANVNNTLFSSSQNNIAYASVGSGLTDSETSTYYDLVNNLQTSLGRGVSNPNAFITVWNTLLTGSGTSNSSSIVLPLFGTQAITASWGDGTVSLISSSTQVDRTHSYATPGIYTVSITGQGQGFRFNYGGDRNKLIDIGQWGSISGSTEDTFSGCANLVGTAPDPHVLQTTSLYGYFLEAFKFNGAIGNWNVSNITNMQNLFGSLSSVPMAFNQNIGSWNVSNVTNMQQTFAACTSFNQNLGSWNVSNVTNMQTMFGECSSFNQNIGSWNVSNTTNMQTMFFKAFAFNNGGSANINNWNTSNVTFMGRMFDQATSFNQNIGSWNVSKVSDMNSMFRSATSFNNSGSSDINNWRPISCSNFSSMFSSATAFNQPIGNWPLSASNINMTSMFQSANSFNRNIGSWDMSRVITINRIFNTNNIFNNSGSSDINNWNTSNIIDMSFAFNDATAFNQPVGNWNVSNVTATDQMFNGASLFNQNIGSWNVSKMTSMREMFRGSGFNNSGSSTISTWTPVSCSDFSGMFQITPFNQPIGTWTLPTNRTFTMANMFLSATSFNQSLGNWTIVSCSSMANMLNNCGMDKPNYSATLQGWAMQAPNIPVGLTLGATGRQYDTAGSSSRAILTSPPYNWNITGDTFVP